jgi:hypothetical protein
MSAFRRSFALIALLICAELGAMWLISRLIEKRLIARIDTHIDQLTPHLQANALMQVTQRLRKD